MSFSFPNGTTTEPRTPYEGEYGPRRPITVPGFAPTRPFHVGHDWFRISAICAIADGIVIWTGVDPSMAWAGVQVLIDHGVHDGQRVWSRSCHLQTATVYPGQRIKAGQQIGVEGATGLAAGVHLHIEVYVGRVNRGEGSNPGNAVSPRDFIRAHLAGSSGAGASTQPVIPEEEDTTMKHLYVRDSGGNLWTLVNTSTGDLVQTREQDIANTWAQPWGNARVCSLQSFLNALDAVKKTLSNTKAEMVELRELMASIEAEIKAA